MFVDSDVPALWRPVPDRSGFTGQVAIELAALLLLDPGRRIAVRAAAAALSRAPSSISEAFRALRAADLVEADGRPAVPGLSWELAEHWKPVSRDVAARPSPDRGRDNAVLHLELDDVESTTGWALTDTVAAAAYGAPVGMRAGHPRDFYVPDQGTLRRAVRLLGPATTSSSRAGRVRLAPVSLVCARRVDATAWTNEEWPLANPLFVALDLAQDPGRGREILDGWTLEIAGLVSGELRVVDLGGTSMTRLVSAIPVVAEQTGRPVVLVGCLAVICRLPAPYRVTTDLDTVVVP